MALENLRIAFPEKDDEWYNKILKECYQFYLKDFFDFFSKYSHFDFKKVDIKNLHIIHESLKEKKGAILVSGHLGPFLKLALTLSKNGYNNISAITYKQKNSAAGKFFEELRKPFILNEIQKGNSSNKIKKSLENNEILALLSDQDAREKGIFVKFFNIPSSTHSGAAKYSKMTGSPLIFFSVIKKGDYYEANLERIDTTMSTEDIVQQYTSMLEQVIRKYPEQYFWQHKRWKTKPK